MLRVWLELASRVRNSSVLWQDRLGWGGRWRGLRRRRRSSGHRLAWLNDGDLDQGDGCERLVIVVPLHASDRLNDQDSGVVALPKDGIVLIEVGVRPLR